MSGLTWPDGNTQVRTVVLKSDSSEYNRVMTEMNDYLLPALIGDMSLISGRILSSIRFLLSACWTVNGVILNVIGLAIVTPVPLETLIGINLSNSLAL